MKYIAFSPDCYTAPEEVLAAKVPAGIVTEKIWRDALSERLIELTLIESNPEKSAEWACSALDCPGIDNPNQIAQFIFERNSNLQTFINLSLIENGPNEYFPLVVIEDDQEALEAIDDTNLFDWVLHVAYFIGGDTLDVFLRHEHEYPN